MKILMLLSKPFTHDPRVYNEAKALIKAGHEVTVLGWDRGGKVALKEKKDGINIVRVRSTKLMELFHYDILKLHLWWREGYKRALELYKEFPFEAVHSHDFDTLPIGIKIKKKLGIPLIYDAHEIWGYMVSKDIPWWRYYIWKEESFLRFVDYMIVTNSARLQFYKEKGVKNIVIVDNCKPIVSKEYIPSNNNIFTLLYIGNLSPTRFLIELVDVVKDIDNVKCIIGGRGKAKYVEKLKQKCNEVKNVEFIGKVPPEEVIPMTLKSDAVFCMIAPWDKNDITASTNKQYEAMVCGRPIISTKGTYSGELTEKEKVGIVVDYNKESLREAIMRLRDDLELREKLGKNALKAALEKYNWEKEKEKLIQLYADIEE